MVGRVRRGFVVLVVLVAGALAPGSAGASVESGAQPGQAPTGGSRGIRITELGGSEVSWRPYYVNRRGQALGLGDGAAYLYDRGRLRQVSPPPPEPSFSLSTASLNDLGDVGGGLYYASFPAPPDPYNARPFLWSGGRQVDLGIAGGAVVADVNNRRQLLLSSYPPGTRPDRVWHDGEIIEPPPLPPGSSRATFSSLSDAGFALGRLDHDDLTGTYEAVIWQIGGPIVPLGTLPGGTQASAIWGTADGTVVGTSNTAAGAPRVFVWRDGEMTDIGTLGGDFTYPSAIDSRGNVVGISSTADGSARAFLWRDGEMVDIAAAEDFEPTAVNVRGQVVGVRTTSQGSQLLLWQSGRTVDLTAMVGGGDADADANDINDRGQVVAGLVDDSSGTVETRAVMWTVPPHWGRQPS